MGIARLEQNEETVCGVHFGVPTVRDLTVAERVRRKEIEGGGDEPRTSEQPKIKRKGEKNEKREGGKRKNI